MKKFLLITLSFFILLSSTLNSYACGKTDREDFKECIETYKIGAYDICSVSKTTIKHYISRDDCSEILQNIKRLGNIANLISIFTGGMGKILLAVITVGNYSIDELERLNNKGCGIIITETIKMCEANQNLLNIKCQTLPLTTHTFSVEAQ